MKNYLVEGTGVLIVDGEQMPMGIHKRLAADRDSKDFDTLVDMVMDCACSEIAEHMEDHDVSWTYALEKVTEIK